MSGAARFEMLVRAVTDYAIYMLDLDGKVASWNAGAERLKGYTECEVIGQHFSQFFTPEDRAANKPATALKTAADTGRWEDEGWRVRKNGTRFWALAVLDAIRDREGKLVGFAKITRDMTERRSLEQAREQLYQAQKMESVGQLTGGVAHDFNNLLTVVSGSLSLLRQMITDQRALNLLDTAERGVARGSGLTQQLLAFSRRHHLQPEEVNANQLIAAFEALLRSASGNIGIHLDLFPALWPANIDPAQFQSALLNLVVNGRDAIDGSNGVITIQTRNCEIDEGRAKTLGEITAGAYIGVAVSDNGSGMSAETKARAIEPFYTTKEPGRGSGLGLSQVYGFVRQSNGQIDIDTEVGRGTTITIFLPALVDELAASDEAGSAKKVGTVLVTEDDRDVLVVAVETLRILGYEVYSASNAVEALAILKRGAPVDVLFADIVMPHGMNGIDLAREARRLRPDIRVLLASGYSSEGIEPGEDMDFIAKPYQMPDLARHLEAVRAR